MAAEISEHHLAVEKTARYYTLGPNDGAATQVWFVCHGYGQLAAKFSRYLRGLDDGTRLVVVPEGLSRYYLESGEGEHVSGDKIGASWMTREGRDHEISDYVNYLDALYDAVMTGTKPTVVAMGFSQGSATVSRWVGRGRSHIDRLVLWGGLLPEDVDDASLRRLSVTIVAGDSDAFITPDRVAAMKTRLDKAGVRNDVTTFAGGHHLDRRVLMAVAAMTSNPGGEK